MTGALWKETTETLPNVASYTSEKIDQEDSSFVFIVHINGSLYSSISFLKDWITAWQLIYNKIIPCGKVLRHYSKNSTVSDAR